jgi:hypothetical protein
MKITKEYLKEVIKEELQTEMFGLDGGQVANVVAGNFVYDVACALASFILVPVAYAGAKLAGAGVGYVGEYISQKAAMKRLARQSEMIKNIANKVRNNEEVLELVKKRKLKLASQKMAEVGLLSPEEKAYCKAVYDLMKSEM